MYVHDSVRGCMQVHTCTYTVYVDVCVTLNIGRRERDERFEWRYVTER